MRSLPALLVALVPLLASGKAARPTPTATPTACALDAAITFGYSGGMTPAVTEHSLTPPAAYLGRTINRFTGDVTACHATLDCAQVDSLRTALADPDVVRALGDQPAKLVGTDSRPVDGSIFFISVGGKRIDIGSDRPATPVPPGLKKLQETFRILEVALGKAQKCEAPKQP